MSETFVASEGARKHLRLHLCPDVGPIRFANLLRELGGIDEVLGASAGRLASVSKVGAKTAESIARHRDRVDVDGEVDLAERHSVRIVCASDPSYPPLLKHIPDPPACLYVRGTTEPEDAVSIAIVGMRRCSRYGSEQAERFAALAAQAGLTIVSGMARGIDSAAHRGALAVEGRTIAVMGCGLCHLYPPESGALAERIVEHGALVSELPMNISPDANNFPPRNRIIAGLALGVLVAEAARRSGSLITSSYAAQYSREVFALPGRIDTPHAAGCHELIQGGAKLVTCLEDILDELGEAGAVLQGRLSPAGEDSGESSGAPLLVPAALDSFEQQVLDALGKEPTPIDAVCEQTGLDPARVAVALTQLQLKGLIRRAGADWFERR